MVNSIKIIKYVNKINYLKKGIKFLLAYSEPNIEKEEIQSFILKLDNMCFSSLDEYKAYRA